jgi:putative ABC transport system permease protein
MKFLKILIMALDMVKTNKLRSWLTIIGVIIGIASVITIVTTGEYFQEQVTETLENLGGDTITIVPSYPFNSVEVQYNESGEISEPEEIENPELTKADVLTLLRVQAVEYVNVNVETGVNLEYGGEETYLWVEGVDPRVWPDITKKKIGEGRMLEPGDRAVVVISNELSNEAFKRQIRLNQMVLLNDKSYRVVGILAKDDGLLGGMSSLFGSSVYMPYKEVYNLKQSDDDLFETEEEVYDSIQVKLYNEADYDAALDEIESRLRLSRRVDEDTQNFYVSSPKEAIESTQKLINGLTAFLALIAGISLLVGSTGIANTMFTSVLEKTKEIGIMKAIGARNQDILLIFLCNAAMIGLVGGIIGILLGTAVVQLILLLISMKMQIPFEFALSVKGTLIATFVSIIVGLIAGLVPAKNASELKPVDSLRYG